MPPRRESRGGPQPCCTSTSCTTPAGGGGSNCRIAGCKRSSSTSAGGRAAADIPGNAIPAVYADYVRTGFERDMDTVLYHNALDLVTLFDLALRLAA